MTEPPFRPRESSWRSRNFSKAFPSTRNWGPYDKVTSVAIPLALAGSSIYLIGRGIYNLSHGIGKKE